MNKAYRTNAVGGARCDDEGAALCMARWLHLAATPAFAIMALLTGVLGGGSRDALCSVAHGASPLNGMVLMYSLMSAFHSTPWLKLLSLQQGGTQRSIHPRG